jgi:hypothetical protein
VERKFNLYDTNDDAKLDLGEFKSCWLEIEPRTPRRPEDSFKLWMELFSLYDMNEDSFIELDEA